MIYDNLNNIATYQDLSKNIRLGLEFLKKVSPDIENGVFQINSKVKVIVSEYETKAVNEHGFEAHRRNIDIQCLLKGEERIACMPIEKLNVTEPYSEEKDAAFYSAEGVKAQEMTIGDGYFAIFYPQDGHMPCLCVDEPMMVKKVVVKVSLESFNI